MSFPTEPTTPGGWLQVIRHDLQMTQGDLGKALGYTRDMVRKMEADERKVSRSAVQRLSALLGLSEFQCVTLERLLRATKSDVPTPKAPLLDWLSVAGRAALLREQSPRSRGIFVGRQVEQGTLQAAFDAAIQGEGGIVFVAGGMGIGKTSLCAQMSRDAAVRGAQVLVGHCCDDESLSIPYLPFVEAFRGYMMSRAEARRKNLRADTTEATTLTGEIQKLLSPSTGGGAGSRWGLFDAVAAFLRDASLSQPLILVLEDLHFADQASLDLLVYLSRHLGDARLLILGTCREADSVRKPSLSTALADLWRTKGFKAVYLRGLTVDDVHTVMTEVTQTEVPQSAAAAMYQLTEGNPLFVQELLREALDTGMPDWEGRFQAALSDPLALDLPRGLAMILQRRLGRLSENARGVLTIASAIGLSFRFDVLRGAAGVTDDLLVSALEEATAAGVVEQPRVNDSLTFWFTHSLFRISLYHLVFSARRSQLHLRVAAALEAAYLGQVDEHAAELAEHLCYSADTNDLRRALGYYRLAAEQATSLHAHADAVRFYLGAVRVQERISPNDRHTRCNLLLALGGALLSSDQLPRVSDVAERAFDLAHELDDSRMMFNACRLGLEAIWLSESLATHNASDRTFVQWCQRADRCADPETVERVYADAFLARMLRNSGKETEAWQSIVTAFGTAQALGDEDALLRVAAAVAHGLVTPVESVSSRLRAAETVVNGEFLRAAPHLLGVALSGSAQAFITWGASGRAMSTIARLGTLAEGTKSPDCQLEWLALQAALETMAGHLAQAVEVGGNILRLGDTAGRTGRARQLMAQATARALLYLGNADEAMRNVPEPEHLWSNGGTYAAQRALYSAYSGRTSSAISTLEQFMGARDLSDSSDSTPVSLLRYLLEIAAVTGHREGAALLCTRLAGLGPLLWYEGVITCLGRHLGACAALVGDLHQARQYFEQALGACLRAGHRPERALVRLELAELLMDHFPDARVQAQAHLDSAITDFIDMGLYAYVERATQRKAGE